MTLTFRGKHLDLVAEADEVVLQRPDAPSQRHAEGEVDCGPHLGVGRVCDRVLEYNPSTRPREAARCVFSG